MKCPHCLVECFPSVGIVNVVQDVDSKKTHDGHYWKAQSLLCPSCGRATILLGVGFGGANDFAGRSAMVRPKVPSRVQLPPDVPDGFSADYKEAALVFGDSPKASAALSRRGLQHLIREKAGIKRHDLATEIEELIASKTLPTQLAEAVDSVRNIGNFAAHPIKSTSTGEIVDVEPGEAEWLLDTLEGLFDFYFIQPAIMQRKKDALNQKLASAGKPPMKEP